MSEIEDILEEIRFKAGIYKDQKRRNEAFNDENYNCFIMLNYIQEKDKEIERLNNIIKSIAHQCYKSDMSYEEFKQIWVNAMVKIYEPSQIDELDKELGVDKK